MSWKQFKISTENILWETPTDYAKWWNFPKTDVFNSYRAGFEISWVVTSWQAVKQ